MFESSTPTINKIVHNKCEQNGESILYNTIMLS